VLNLHIIDLARKYYTHLQRENEKEEEGEVTSDIYEKAITYFLLIIFLTFDSYSRKVTIDSYEKTIVTIVLTIVFIITIKNIILVYCFSHIVLVPDRSQVITLKGAIVMVEGGNI